MTKQTLTSQAEAQVARYPQYKGHFDGYILVRVKREVKTKSGVAFSAGELAIAKPETHYPESGPLTKVAFLTVWSAKNAVDTSVKKAWVEILDPQ